MAKDLQIIQQVCGVHPTPDIKYAWYKCPGSLLLVIGIVSHEPSESNEGRMCENSMFAWIGD